MSGRHRQIETHGQRAYGVPSTHDHLLLTSNFQLPTSYLLVVPCPGTNLAAAPYSLSSRQMNSISSPPPVFRSGRRSRPVNFIWTVREKAPGSSSVNSLTMRPQLMRVHRSIVCICSVCGVPTPSIQNLSL